MSEKAARKRKEEDDDDDGVFDDDDSDIDSGDDSDSSSEGDVPQPPAAKKRKTTTGKQSFIDDAAEESGDEDGGDDDEEEEEDDEEGEGDYIKDGFVVDEEEEEEKKKKDDLEDSDEDEEEEEEDDEGGKGRLTKIRKVQEDLDEEDLALIKESQRREAGLESDEEDFPPPEEDVAEKPKERVVAKTEEELKKGLFHDSGDEEETQVQRRRAQMDRYDEDGMDDFIEDDIGDQEAIRMSDRKAGFYADEETREVSEAQLNEASEIFGTDYLDFMQETEPADEDEEDLMGRDKYRERGVGVSYGMDSEDEVMSDDGEDEDDDDELFGDEDDDSMDIASSKQKAEALRLKREKRRLAKAERRRQAEHKKAERHKALLRRAFEPVQLVENFCTERDDDIRQVDLPERFYDWKVPFHGSDNEGMNTEEEEEARWIAKRIPEIAAELALTEKAEKVEESQKTIFESIAYALRYIHKEKLEPAFIKRYRADYVRSPAVRNNLYSVMDEDGEWDRMMLARQKVEDLLEAITRAANSDESVGADAQKLIGLQQELEDARKKLDETAKQESQVEAELNALKAAEDDDDDELFGDDDEVRFCFTRERAKRRSVSFGKPESNDLFVRTDPKEKKKEKERISSHLETIQSLLEARADKVSQLQARVTEVDEQNKALNDPGPVERITKKMCRDRLWSTSDYSLYLSTLDQTRHIFDMSAYLNLLKEGNNAIRKKEMPVLADDSGESRRRSRRFDRDFYRTCVAEGLRDICYRFVLAPNRVGIKLEDTVMTGGFDYAKTLSGEKNSEGAGNPMKWVPPVIPTSPEGFASDLIGSGELVLLSSSSGGEADANGAGDPLRGCRYVAAMELAYEPRVRRYLRDIFRRHAVLTTKPTKKGLNEIDAFHDYYGLHLIRGKPVKDHFPEDENESFTRRENMSAAEITLRDREMKKRERDSCLQYLNILKAESTRDITVHIHMPLLEWLPDWYEIDAEQLMSVSNQNLYPLMSELLRVYMPSDGDTTEWEEERKKVLHFALMKFLLPQFEAETRRDLREAATKIGVLAAASSLKESAMEGPYRPTAILHVSNRFVEPTGDFPIVGVCCASDGKDATYLASVTDRGESNDFLAVPPGVQVNSDKMREKVITFLLQSRPAAVVVGTSGGFESRSVQRKMIDLIAEAVKRWSNRNIQGVDEDDEAFEARQAQFHQFQATGYYEDDDKDESWTCNVELVDDSVAQLFGRSVRGKKEFPDYAVNLKSAISVARYAKDPLSELTYAWSVASDAGVFGTEMLFMNIHPLQQLLPKTLLLRQYERVLCEVVADVGADLNRCCTFDHLRGQLMFVPGFGPRKAANLKQLVTQIGSTIARRRDLLEKRLIGPIVYNNAVAFLRIRELDQLTDQFLHPLDETRLHPDTYLRNNWAVKIAYDSLEREETSEREMANFKALGDVMDNSKKEVRRLFEATKEEYERVNGPSTFNIKDWDPRVHVPPEWWGDKVEELDLESFATIIEENGQGRWLSHLDMIKWEFRLPFADPRKPMEPLSGDKLFRLITGETDQSVRPGKELTGKVVRNRDCGSDLKLEGGMPAFILLRNLSDEHVETAEDIVTTGQVVTAVVTEVKKDHMSVDMSLRMDDFRKTPSSWARPPSLPPLDICFDKSAASSIEEFCAKAREAHIEAIQASLGAKSAAEGERGGSKTIGRIFRRACTHPAFVNETHAEVDRRLRQGGASVVGDALIRPSSKSSDSLQLYWVVKEEIIKVIEVKEEEKETDVSIGNKLIVKVSFQVARASTF